jgi:hypothetical protein
LLAGGNYDGDHATLNAYEKIVSFIEPCDIDLDIIATLQQRFDGQWASSEQESVHSSGQDVEALLG